MNLKSQISNLKSPECDLCGSTESDFVFSTSRLDGPLVRCRRCELYYVILKSDLSEGESRDNGHGGIEGVADQEMTSSHETAAEMERLAGRASELALVEPQVELGESPWRELMAKERLDDLKRFVAGGRLLEIGSSSGEMLASAASSFVATGIEADSKLSRIARARGLDCFNGTLADAKLPDDHFDVVALYHVIEHFRSPRAELREMSRILKPGGMLVMETPNIATLWFHLLGARWRQFIPDHIFFFTPQTIKRLCEETGFDVFELRNVGKAMSVRLFISRLGRYHRPTARFLTTISSRLSLDHRTLRLNLGDVMRLYAYRR